MVSVPQNTIRLQLVKTGEKEKANAEVSHTRGMTKKTLYGHYRRPGGLIDRVGVNQVIGVVKEYLISGQGSGRSKRNVGQRRERPHPRRWDTLSFGKYEVLPPVHAFELERSVIAMLGNHLFIVKQANILARKKRYGALGKGFACFLPVVQRLGAGIGGNVS
jgi:hypothetical protein